MAYSKNIKRLAIELIEGQGRSPEDVVYIISAKLRQGSTEFLTFMEESGIPGSEADYLEVLEKIPEARTIRGWIPNRKSNDSRWQGTTDPEQSLHFKELFYFGLNLRDQLEIPRIEDVVGFRSAEEALLWNGPPPRRIFDDWFARFAAEWGAGLRDATKNGLFPYFQQHLDGNDCWVHIDMIITNWIPYKRACDGVLGGVVRRLESEDIKVTDEAQKQVALSILTNAFAQGALGKLQYDLSVRRSQSNPQWEAALGTTSLARESEKDAVAIINICNTLTYKVGSEPELKNAVKIYQKMGSAKESFRSELTPEARLRQIILRGSCELCPLA